MSKSRNTSFYELCGALARETWARQKTNGSFRLYGGGDARVYPIPGFPVNPEPLGNERK